MVSGSWFASYTQTPRHQEVSPMHRSHRTHHPHPAEALIERAWRAHPVALAGVWPAVPAPELPARVTDGRSSGGNAENGHAPVDQSTGSA